MGCSLTTPPWLPFRRGRGTPGTRHTSSLSHVPRRSPGAPEAPSALRARSPWTASQATWHSRPRAQLFSVTRKREGPGERVVIGHVRSAVALGDAEVAVEHGGR